MVASGANYDYSSALRLLLHGKPDQIHHDEEGLFAGLPNPFAAMRYHSLVARRETLPTGVRVTATLADGTIMAVERPGLCVYGVQFHPESIGTPDGDALIANFLTLARRTDGAAATMPVTQ